MPYKLPNEDEDPPTPRSAQNVASLPPAGKEELEYEPAESSAADDELPVEELVSHFLAVSRCRPPNGRGDYVEEWIRPLVTIYQAAGGDFEETKRRIDYAIAFCRDGGKRYTIRTPASIQNAAVNWDADEEVRGEVPFR